jgi:transcriptional regulator with XRE-family HTH domain
MLRGERLRDLRVAKEYTYERLAELLDLSMRQVMRYEAGDSEPTGGVIARMSQIFNVTTDYLLGRTDDPTPYLSVDNLTIQERNVLAALRRNQPIEAIRAIIADL